MCFYVENTDNPYKNGASYALFELLTVYNWESTNSKTF